MSPGSYRGSFDSTTSPTACAVITSPTSRPFAYERAVLMRPRWYGSTETQCVRTSTSPGPGDGTSASSSAKSDSCGNADRPRRHRHAPVYVNCQPSPDSNAFRIRRATTMRCTSSGPS